MTTRSKSHIYKYLSSDQRQQLLREQLVNFEAQMLNHEMDIKRLEGAATSAPEAEQVALGRAVAEREDAIKRLELAIQITEREMTGLVGEASENGRVDHDHAVT